MQYNLRQCDFTNVLTSKNPISSYFCIPLVFGKLVLCMKNNRFCFVYTDMDLGKNAKNITTWKRALEMLHSFCIFHIFSMLQLQLYIYLYLCIQINSLSNTLLTRLNISSNHEIPKYMKLEKQAINLPSTYTIKVTVITRQIKNYVCGCVYTDVGACG